VLDAAGEPVRGARIVIETVGLPPAAQGWDPAAGIEAFSGDDGRFTLPAPSQLRSLIAKVSYRVAASHPILGSGRTVPLPVVAVGQAWPDAHLSLSSGGSVEGSVTDAAGSRFFSPR
jgi:hypothetical protein